MTDEKLVSFTDARAGLGDIINRAAYGGERVVIGRRGKPAAVVVSVEDLAALEAFEDAADAQAYRDAKAADDGARFSLDDIKAEFGV